jgi:hypothetical protein
VKKTFIEIVLILVLALVLSILFNEISPNKIVLFPVTEEETGDSTENQP